jgi:hypothetical protein
MTTCKNLNIELCVGCNNELLKYCIVYIWLKDFEMHTEREIANEALVRLRHHSYQYNYWYLAALEKYNKHIFASINKLRILL